jgi:DNA recombination protein RmuC
MDGSNAVVVVLCLLVIALLVAMAFMLRALTSIQGSLANAPTAQISTGIASVQSEQARTAQELGRAAGAIGALQNVQQSVDVALRTLAGQATVRAEADAQSRDLLKRLELVIAGSFQRGAAGENLLAEVLANLPAGMLERNVPVAGGTVEFAVRVPGGKFIPIDSKWPGAQLLDRLSKESDATKRDQIIRELDRQVTAKAEEVAKYLDPERTLLLGVAALPDAVYQLCRTAHAQAFKRGVVLLPYSLAIPYILSMIVLIARFGGALDTTRVRSALAKVDETLHQLEESIEGHMSRGLTMLSNAVQNQRSGIGECRSMVTALRARDEAMSFQDPATLPDADAASRVRSGSAA